MKYWEKSLRLVLACAAYGFVISVHPVRAAEDHHQHHAAQAPGYTREVVAIRLQETTLVRSDGATAIFPREIDDGKPVVLNFVYTTCTTVCPVLSHSFADFQRKLGAERDKVRMVSISICLLYTSDAADE